MKSIVATIVLLSLSTAACGKDVRFQETQSFGTEPVTMRITNAYDTCPDAKVLSNQLAMTADTVEQERLAQRLWECGDSWMLLDLAAFAERRADLVGAYANLYAANRIVKTSLRYNPKGLEVRGQVHSAIAGDIARLDKKLTDAQRASAIRRAAQLIRDNPNCCMGF
jgi:hypothetical protein